MQALLLRLQSQLRQSRVKDILDDPGKIMNQFGSIDLSVFRKPVQKQCKYADVRSVAKISWLCSLAKPRDIFNLIKLILISGHKS